MEGKKEKGKWLLEAKRQRCRRALNQRRERKKTNKHYLRVMIERRCDPALIQTCKYSTCRKWNVDGGNRERCYVSSVAPFTLLCFHLNMRYSTDITRNDTPASYIKFCHFTLMCLEVKCLLVEGSF